MSDTGDPASSGPKSAAPSIEPTRGRLGRAERVVGSGWFVVVCVVVGVLLRLACIALFPVRPTTDFEWYFNRAAGLAAGEGVVNRGFATAYWPVGYPAFLGLVFLATGPSALVAQLCNVVFAAATILLARGLTLRLSGSRVAAGLAAAMLALHPNGIAYATLVSSELFATLLLLVGMTLLVASDRFSTTAAAGLVFGGLCLAKPQAVLLPALCLAVVWRLRGDGRSGLARLGTRLAVLYVALGLTLVPWTVRNYRTFGGFVFIANTSGVNLRIGNNPDATGTYPAGAEEAKLIAELPRAMTAHEEYANDRAARARALSFVEAHPWRLLERAPATLFYLFAKDADGFSWIGEGESATAPSRRMLPGLKWLAEGYWALLFGAFALSLSPWRASGGGRPLFLALAVCGYFSAIYLLYFGIPRFHAILLPWIAMQAASWLARPATTSS